jgi:hypothetical protein
MAAVTDPPARSGTTSSRSEKSLNTCRDHLVQGCLVAVEGRIRTGGRTDGAGNKRTEIKADVVHCLAKDKAWKGKGLPPHAPMRHGNIHEADVDYWEFRDGKWVSK